jgi:hypothetical protein
MTIDELMLETEIRTRDERTLAQRAFLAWNAPPTRGGVRAAVASTLVRVGARLDAAAAERVAAGRSQASARRA